MPRIFKKSIFQITFNFQRPNNVHCNRSFVVCLPVNVINLKSVTQCNNNCECHLSMCTTCSTGATVHNSATHAHIWVCQVRERLNAGVLIVRRSRIHYSLCSSSKLVALDIYCTHDTCSYSSRFYILVRWLFFFASSVAVAASPVVAVYLYFLLLLLSKQVRRIVVK